MRRSKNRPAFPYWYKQYCQTGNSYWLKLFNRNGKRCNKKHKGQCNSLWESVQRGEEPLKVFVIAEAGINHNGELKLAKKLVDAAKDAGADCIKFQTFISKILRQKTLQRPSTRSKQNPKNLSMTCSKGMNFLLMNFRS